MKIRQMQFYQYGHFSDVTFDLPSHGLQVLYGENEAGKSTMMQFIHDILFGFTNQSPGIANDSGIFGGALKIEFPVQGPVRIERTGKKGNGQVKIHLPDGKTAGEEMLRDWLPGLDESMFRAIFCFDLDGLQKLEKVKAEELNDYLFHAGMTGNFSIRELEKKLQKKKEALFKPHGRKPKLNKVLYELEKLEEDVSDCQLKNEGYRDLLEDSVKIEDRLKEIQMLQKKHKIEIRLFEKRKTLIPYIRECRQLEWRLAQLNGSVKDFPDDGLSRYERWQNQAVTLEAELAELELRRKRELEKESEIEIKQDWTRLRKSLQREKEQEPFVQNRKSEHAAAKQTAKTEDEEIAVLMEQLGPYWSREQISIADTSFAAKEKLKKLTEELAVNRQRWDMLNEERARSERLVEESERELVGIREERLDEDEHAECEKKVAAYENEVSKQSKDDLKQLGQPGMSFGAVGFAMILAVWLFFKGQSPVAVAMILFAGLLAFYGFRSSKGMARKQARSREVGKIEVKINEAERARLLLEKDLKAQTNESLSADRLAQREEALAEIVEQTEAVRQRLKKIESEMGNWKEDHHFPLGEISTKWFEISQRVEEVKTRIRKHNRAKSLCQTIEEENAERRKKIESWCRDFGISFENESSALTRMSERVAEQEQLERKRNQFMENAKAYEEQIVSLKVKVDRYRKECESLLVQAEAEDEEDFRSKAKASAQRKETKEKLDEIQARMKALGADEKEQNEAAEAIKIGADVDERIRVLEDELGQLEEEVRTLYERAAKVDEKRQKLEDGGSYAELLHAFELKRNEFREESRKWAVYRTAEHLLKKAKEQYREKRLPAVIEAASKRFEDLTDGRYMAVFAPVEEGFVVERKDGARFKPEQLSRGTREQLYMSLRLALASIYQAPSPYPFIMDDVLVNFDESRTKQAVHTIREVAGQRQMLFFTCHKHLLARFQEKEIVSVQGDRLYSL